MTSLSQVEDALFLKQLHPVLSSKPVMFAGSILKNALSIGLRFDVDGNSTTDQVSFSPKDTKFKLTDFLTDLSDTILFFDDLERCQVEVENVLGFINNFVEHQGLKVIIVANEDELSINKENKNNTYRLIKEKLIGKTLTINLDFEGAITNFIKLAEKSEKESEVRTFLSSKIELIEKIYQLTKYKNLRTLRQVVLDFERIFKFLPEEAKSNSEALEVLLRLLIIFSIEIKLDNINSKEVGELYEQHQSVLREQYSLSNTLNDKGHDKEKTSFQKLFEKYKDPKLKNQLPLSSPFPNFAWWGDFLDKGILDEEKLAKSLLTSVYFADKNTPDWIKLWHHADLSDDEFEKLINKVELKYSLKNNSEEFVKVEEIQQALGLFLLFSDIGLYSKTKQEILESFKSYAKKLSENNKLDMTSLHLPLFQQEIAGYLRLGFQGNNFKEFKEFFSYIKEIHKKVKSDNLSVIAQELLEVMNLDVWKFYKMVVREENLRVWDEENGKYADVPILKHIEEASFLDKFLQLSYKDKRTICYALDKRHDFKKEDLLEELDWLKRILKLIEQEVASRKGKLSGYLLDSLIEEYFNKIINKIETYAQSKETGIDL